MAITLDDVHAIVKSAVDEWNEAPPPKLWVMLAKPGDHINIPGVQFPEKPHAGMSQLVHAEVIVLNNGMRPESILSAFYHELGHCLYRRANPGAPEDAVKSEVAAIRHSLLALSETGLDDLAFQEADAAKNMAGAYPYDKAVAVLSDDPIWKKFARTP